ncbi:unnamed protein product [Macrosiphum euphorbiae]|nr:unnamed protein product [Macrosiphum euphorbiae]
MAIQAYIQTTQEWKFLNIWEKLGELENGYSKQTTNNQQEIPRSRPTYRSNPSYKKPGPPQSSNYNNIPTTPRQTNNVAETDGNGRIYDKTNITKNIKQIMLTGEEEEPEDVTTESNMTKNYEQGTVESD